MTLALGCQLWQMIAFLTGLIPFPRDLSQLYPLASLERMYGWIPWKNICDATQNSAVTFVSEGVRDKTFLGTDKPVFVNWRDSHL